MPLGSPILLLPADNHNPQASFVVFVLFHGLSRDVPPSNKKQGAPLQKRPIESWLCSCSDIVGFSDVRTLIVEGQNGFAVHALARGPHSTMLGQANRVAGCRHVPLRAGSSIPFDTFRNLVRIVLAPDITTTLGHHLFVRTVEPTD